MLRKEKTEAMLLFFSKIMLYPTVDPYNKFSVSRGGVIELQNDQSNDWC